MSKAGNYIVAAAYFVAGYYTGNPGYIQMGYAALASGAIASDRERKARNRARDAYNASLQDRMVMLDLQPNAPRTLALGRVRAVEGVRRRWSSGVNSEKLTLIVSFAGHEIDAFETFWFNDIELTLDGDGYVQTAPYLRTDARTDSMTATADGSGDATVTITSTPVSGSEVTAVYVSGTGDAQTQGECTVTHDTGLVYDISGAIAGSTITVTWQTTTATSYARIRPYLGTATQNVGSDLAADYPGKITSTDKFAGIALAVIDLEYSDDVFPQGIPNITATFRGAKCLDPRTSTTAWTENPALHAYHYARWANGWNVPVGKIRTQDVEDAADECDTSTVFTLGVDDVTLPRYRCGIVLSTDADPRSNMGAIMETMAGRWGWAGGTLRMRCGRMAAPTWAMDESWIAAPLGAGGQPGSGTVVRISNGVPRDEKVNHVAGTCVDPDQRYQALPYPTVRDTVLIAADGAEYRLDADLPGVNHIAHAQHLASITIREGQAPLRMEVMSNLSAYRCELFDVGEVTLDRYGMTDKTFEVIGWRWRPADGVMLRLSEITAAIFEPVDTLNGRDPAPNGDLPNPWEVEQIEGVAVESGTDELTDTSIITRTRVTWDAAVSQAVRVGGRIEVQYTLAASALPTGEWPSVMEQGDSTSTTIAGLLTGRFYLFRVRAINSLGVRGPWSAQVLHQVALPPGLGGGTLRLTTDRFPYFLFADGTTHTASAPGDGTLTITAALASLVGTPTFTAEAFNASNASLGTFTLGGSGLARTMTAAQFTSLGTSGSVRRVVVTATLGSATDSLTVFRQDSTTTAPRIFLDNPVAQVPTDEAGEFGDYSGAATGVLVYAGTSDVTSTYTFAITPDAGVTATINGGAGPVSGTGSVAVAVSNSTIDDAAVLITTSGPGVLTATFRVLKSKASGAGYTAYFEPRTEIVLPVNADGITVSTFADAWSTLRIIKGGTLDDTAQWSLSKVDTNVTSTLTGARVDITAMPGLGQTGTTTSASFSNATGWTRPQSMVYGGGVYLILGYHASTDFTHIKRSTDFSTWTDINTGVSGQWQFGDYGNGRFILPDWDAVTAAYIQSTDGGLTWTTGSFGISQQWSCIHYGGGLWMAGALGSATGRISSNDGSSWSSITFPAVPNRLQYAAGRWYLESTGQDWYVSSNNGTSWSSALTAIAFASYVRGVSGRAVAVMSSGGVAKYTENGTTWTTVQMASTASPILAQVVRGVLYVVGSGGGLQFTSDGRTWRSTGGTAATSYSNTGSRLMGADMDLSTLRGLDISGTTGSWRSTPLLATSDDTGAVTVTATKAGELDIVRALPVRKAGANADVYTSQATPASVLLPSTSDGVVTSYAAGVVVAQINRNGVDDTANWTITWTTTNLTPSSGSGATVTLTAMTDGILSGLISFTATKPGAAVITGQVGVFKSYGVESSGPRIGAAFNAITATATFIGLKFVGDGRFQIKVGSGGSYTDAGQWAGAIRSSNASTYWIRVDATGHSLASGTTGTWLAMTSDREYTLSDATSGTHRTDLQVSIGTSSSGANAVLASGALQLIVP